MFDLKLSDYICEENFIQFITHCKGCNECKQGLNEVFNLPFLKMILGDKLIEIKEIIGI